MVRKFFFFLSDHVVTAYEWHAGIFFEGPHLELSKDGLQKFEQYLDQIQLNGPVYLLIDVTEEEIHEEVVPKLMGRNRKKILQQRASRIFRNTPYVYHRFQGLVQGNKKKEHALFVGLTDPENVTPWMEILTRRQAQIVGIWSLPLLALQVFHRILPKDTSVLLVSPNSGGLRQIFVQNKKIKVSRLSHLPSREPETVMLFIHGEISRLMGYLGTLRLLANDQKLDVFILCPKELLAYIINNPHPMTTHQIHPIDAETLALDYGLKNGLPDEKVDILFGHFLLKHRVSNHYAQPELIQRHRIAEICYWLRTLAIILLICGVGLGLVAFYEGYRNSEQLPALLQKLDAAQLSLRKYAIEEFEKVGGGRDRVASAQIMQKINELKSTPQHAMIFISKALANFDDLWIDGIDWESPPKEIPPKEIPNPQQTAKTKNNTIPKPNRALGSVRVKPSMAQYGVPNQLVRLTGQIYPFNESPHDAQLKIERFINLLRSMPEVLAVETEKMPMDANQNAVLDSSNLAKTKQSSFILRIVINFGKNNHG
ncbi:MAG: hypothetical protein HQL74_03285 [Magnetococcales bacterium]|nr:hypothetical protein [Magnetococcales bacterium]